MEFAYKPNMEAYGEKSLDQLGAEDFEVLRRRAFLDGKDSMAGMRQVRELLAQRHGHSAEDARKLSVSALEQPKAIAAASNLLAHGDAVPSWNLSNAQGAGAPVDYGTAGEKGLDSSLAMLPGALISASELQLPASVFTSAAGERPAMSVASGATDVAFNAPAAQSQPADAVAKGASANGIISGAGGEVPSPSQLGGGGLNVVPAGADFRATYNDWAQSDSGLRGKIGQQDTSAPAPWQLSQQPIVMNGEVGRDGRLAAFAALGQEDPSRSMAEVLAASPFGSRDGQSMAGATTDLSALDATKLYGRSAKPVQVSGGNTALFHNPGNW